MTFRQLQFFKRVAELENISKAAEEFYIAQPALSKMIKDIESELGYPLFERNSKKISLNYNGEILYKHILRLQYEILQMENELLEANAKKSATVHVSIRVASKLLPNILNTFYQKHPEINLKIYQNNQATKSVPDYDVIIDSREVKSSNFLPTETLLLEERLLLALPSKHPLAEKKSIKLSDLTGYPCCLLNEFSSLGKMVRSILSPLHFTPNIILESDNPHMIRDFLRLDLSYSFVPEKTWLIKDELPNLILREVEDFNCCRFLYLTHGQSVYISKAAKEFVSHVKEYFKNNIK